MQRFSERMGLTPKKAIQVDAIDEETRNRLWNMLCVHYWDKVPRVISRNRDMYILLQMIWNLHFKKTLDTLNADYWRQDIKEYFFDCSWYQVFDFIQFVANNYPDETYPPVNPVFKLRCNFVLEEEVSVYRFVGDVIARDISDEEIVEIEEALSAKGLMQPVANQLKTALQHFADRESPDYDNSIKESISATETMCNLVAGTSKKPMGDALKEIKKQSKVRIHHALIAAFGNLYGYATGTVRHGKAQVSSEGAEEARLMLVTCSAIVNYLKVKADEAGIKL